MGRFCRDQSGSYLVLSGLLVPALIGVAALGVELGLSMYKHQNMQSAADSAALSAAAAYYVQGNAYQLDVQAEAVTASYGFVNGAGGVTVTVNQPPKSGNHMTAPGAVEVLLQQPQARLFSSIYSSQPFPIGARAVAAPNSTTGCVLALNRTASGAATVQGTAQVTLHGCSLFDNSGSSSALTVGGSASLSAVSVGVTGGVSGTANITTTQGVATGQPPAADPYANTSFPPFSGCGQSNYSTKSKVTIHPGVYCGGMSLNAGADVTLSPGIYYLDQGSFTVNGGATVTGSDVTLVFTSSTGSNWATASINGGAKVDLSAPASGWTKGIVMFGDRDAPAGTSFKFNGGSSQLFGGAVYLPKGAISFAGGAGTSTDCTQIIGDTVTFVGNSDLAVNCSGRGTNALGSAVAVLVE